MRPPRFDPEDWCHCPDGRHLNRYLAQGETVEEQAIVHAFFLASTYPWLEEIEEANRRFLGPDPTSEENWTWVRETRERELDHL